MPEIRHSFSCNFTYFLLECWICTFNDNLKTFNIFHSFSSTWTGVSCSESDKCKISIFFVFFTYSSKISSLHWIVHKNIDILFKLHSKRWCSSVEKSKYICLPLNMLNAPFHNSFFSVQCFTACHTLNACASFQ